MDTCIDNKTSMTNLKIYDVWKSHNDKNFIVKIECPSWYEECGTPIDENGDDMYFDSRVVEME